MILRKPYAFLIKYFKIIHLVLTLCAIYLVTRINGILGYYNSFIDGTVGKLGAAEFFGSMYIYITIISIIICLVIIFLMRYKKKSYLFYVVLIGYFLVSSLLIKYSVDGLYKIYVYSLDTKTLLLYRDILKIMSFVQYIFVAMPLVRGLGFDIKKFNFVEDLVELNIDVDDDEEVELTVGGLEASQRKLNRNIREFKYYYLENKPLINSILIGVVLVCVGIYFVNSLFLNPVYKVNDSFSFDNFTFKVLNSYVSNIGYDNQKLSNGDTTFVLVNMQINNNATRREVNTANFILEIGDKSYASNVTTSKFMDLGTVYRDAYIEGEAVYLFVFEIPEELSKDNMKLNLGNEKTVKLNPVFLDEISEKKNYKIGEVVNMSNSFYGNGNFKIESCEISDKFNYSYTYEVMDKSYDGNITISSVNGIVMNLVMNGSYPAGYKDYSFLKKYGKIKYTIGDKEYVSGAFEDKTPNSYKKGLYLVVDKEIKDASSIVLEVTIRNVQYVYKLK